MSKAATKLANEICNTAAAKVLREMGEYERACKPAFFYSHHELAEYQADFLVNNGLAHRKEGSFGPIKMRLTGYGREVALALTVDKE